MEELLDVRLPLHHFANQALLSRKIRKYVQNSFWSETGSLSRIFFLTFCASAAILFTPALPTQREPQWGSLNQASVCLWLQVLHPETMTRLLFVIFHSLTLLFRVRECGLMSSLKIVSLLLWAEKTREQNTCKSDLNRIMTERPNICYIFEKLSVQGCQIWHSHVVIPFNSPPAHSTRPHNAKKALYVIISAEIPENLVHKSCCHKH